MRRTCRGEKNVTETERTDIPSDMTIEQQIGQLFIVGFHGTTPSPEITELIERFSIGGVILFSRNIADTEQLFEMTSALQASARAAGHFHPLLIATDQENGLVRRLGPGSTRFPGNMALGAVGSDELTYEVARATGAELRALGVNMNLAPVLDVNNNPANPVIGTRSFGEDPQLVARLGAAAVRGYREARVICTLKHFPGHGDTAVDSHKTLPTIPATIQRLDAVEMVPFRAAIEAGADTVMVAHIFLPALMAGPPSPASLSADIIGGLLHERLGFDGPVVTDCLEMGAIAETVGVAPGTVAAVRAGADLVMVSHRHERQLAALEAVRDALRSGTLDAGRVREAAGRVVDLKRRSLSWDTLPRREDLSVVGSAEHARLRDEAYARTTTLVRDEAGHIPVRLRPEQSLLVITYLSHDITNASDIYYDNGVLADALRAYHTNVQAVTLSRDSLPEEMRQLADTVAGADMTLFVSINAHLDAEQRGMVGYLASAARRSVGLAVCDPYDAAALPELRTYLATYEYTQPALEAAARVIFGRSRASGHVPVTLAMPR